MSFWILKLSHLSRYFNNRRWKIGVVVEDNKKWSNFVCILGLQRNCVLQKSQSWQNNNSKRQTVLRQVIGWNWLSIKLGNFGSCKVLSHPSYFPDISFFNIFTTKPKSIYNILNYYNKNKHLNVIFWFINKMILILGLDIAPFILKNIQYSQLTI